MRLIILLENFAKNLIKTMVYPKNLVDILKGISSDAEELINI